MEQSATNEETKQAVCDAKERIDTLIHDQYHRHAVRLGLSLDQFHLLIEMDELMLDLPDQVSGLSVGKIADHIGNAQNTISERITRLEEKGLVVRTRDPQDRRVSRVSLTRAGRDLIGQINVDTVKSTLNDALDTLSMQELDSLLATMQKIIFRLEKNQEK